MKELLEAAGGNAERMVTLRRQIHQTPELGLHTPATRELVVAELEKIGVDAMQSGDDCTWLTADLIGTGTGAGPGARSDAGKAKVVALRADTDALPLTEKTGLDYASRIEGRMHACGHDAHTAMLVGAASVLAGMRDRFAGTVRLMFQPGEEGLGGARVMIEDGAFDDVESAFAIHLQPSARSHRVLFRAGTMLAAFDDFTVTFEGAGGHASTPHAALDPIPAIGPFVDGLSHVAARETDPDDRTVFSVSHVVAGTKENVIPSEARCSGTIRSVSPRGRERALERMHRVAHGVAASRGLQAHVDVRPGYPPTMNDAHAIGEVLVAASAIGLETREMRGPFMGAEDFAYFLERVPGAMVFLGCRTDGAGPLHSDRMMIDESVMPTGAALHAAVALQMLGAAAAGPPSSRV